MVCFQVNLSQPLQSLHFQMDSLLFLNIEHMFHGDNSETFNIYVEVDYCILCGYIWKGRSYLYSLVMDDSTAAIHRILVYPGKVKYTCMYCI